jgi:hypothetical protein
MFVGIHVEEHALYFVGIEQSLPVVVNFTLSEDLANISSATETNTVQMITDPTLAVHERLTKIARCPIPNASQPAARKQVASSSLFRILISKHAIPIIVFPVGVADARVAIAQLRDLDYRHLQLVSIGSSVNQGVPRRIASSALVNMSITNTVSLFPKTTSPRCHVHATIFLAPHSHAAESQQGCQPNPTIHQPFPIKPHANPNKPRSFTKTIRRS